MFRFTSARPGLTRIDVVVLLAIGSIAIGLGSCWMTDVRTPAARTQSLSNLGQISKAAHNWASASSDANSMPHAGYVHSTSSGQQLVGPYAAVLPQMEASASHFEPSDIIKVFSSPHDTTVKDLAGNASYAWNGAWIMEKTGEAKLTPKDGASNTIMLSERVMDCNGSVNKWSGTHPGTDQVANGKPFIPGVSNSTASSYGTAGKPPAWDTNTPAKAAGSCDNTTPSGCHTNVILFAMGDGSTRAVTRSAGNPQNWTAAITPASDDTFDSNW